MEINWKRTVNPKGFEMTLRLDEADIDSMVGESGNLTALANALAVSVARSFDAEATHLNPTAGVPERK